MKIFATLHLKNPTECDDKNNIHKVERAKLTAKMAAQSLEQAQKAQIEGSFQIKKLIEQYYKVLQNIPQVCLSIWLSLFQKNWL